MFLVPSHDNKENSERTGNLKKFQRLLSTVLRVQFAAPKQDLEVK
jgi:hypothetical protein